MSEHNDFTKSIKDAAKGVADMAKEIASAAGGKAREYAAEAGERAKSLSRAVKLKVDIGAETEKKNEALLEIGKLYFERADKLHVEPEFVRLFDRVLLADSNLETMQAELTELREEADIEVEVTDADFEDIVSQAEAEAATEEDTEE